MAECMTERPQTSNASKYRNVFLVSSFPRTSEVDAIFFLEFIHLPEKDGQMYETFTNLLPISVFLLPWHDLNVS